MFVDQVFTQFLQTLLEIKTNKLTNINLCNMLTRVSRASVSTFVERTRLNDKIKNDPDQLKEALKVGEFSLWNKGQVLLNSKDDRIIWFNHKTAKNLSSNLAKEAIYLKLDTSTGKALFALPCHEDINDRTNAQFCDIRSALFQMNQDDIPIACQGWNLLRWLRKTKFCSGCGQALEKKSPEAGSSTLFCSSCNSDYYPSVRPVGIALVTSLDNNRIVLVRQPKHPAGYYTCIAGFADPGETLQDCVRREVAEEVGLQAQHVEVQSSQYWPFPLGSLMMGCVAKTDDNHDPDPCKMELEDARWFHFTEVEKMMQHQHEDNLMIPPPFAIARHLISSWLESHKK